jgi:hypothetical protein
MSPSDCKLCGRPTHTDDGRAIGEVLVYQFVDGRMTLAAEPQMGYTLLYIHAKCIRDVNDGL